MRKLLVFIILALVTVTVSCRKNRNFSNSPSLNISLSNDTITFDTVFTAVGSSTRILMIYNKNSENLKINSIRLGGGASSPFSINVDGQPPARATISRGGPRTPTAPATPTSTDRSSRTSPSRRTEQSTSTRSGLHIPTPPSLTKMPRTRPERCPSWASSTILPTT